MKTLISVILLVIAFQSQAEESGSIYSYCDGWSHDSSVNLACAPEAAPASRLCRQVKENDGFETVLFTWTEGGCADALGYGYCLYNCLDL